MFALINNEQLISFSFFKEGLLIKFYIHRKRRNKMKVSPWLVERILYYLVWFETIDTVCWIHYVSSMYIK